MRWCCCCFGSSSSSASSSSSSIFEEENHTDGTSDSVAVANGGKRIKRWKGLQQKLGGRRGKGQQPPQQKQKQTQRTKKGVQLKQLSGGTMAKVTASAASAENSRRPPEGILKGTHARGSRPPRAVQYADGTNSGGDIAGGATDATEAGEQRAMLLDSPPSSCSSPSSPPLRSLSATDQYGPMLLRQCKRALLVLPSPFPCSDRLPFCCSFSSSSSSSASFSSSVPSSHTFDPPNWPFIAALRQSGWEVQACTSSVSGEEIRQRRPAVVLLDGTNQNELCTMVNAVRGDDDHSDVRSVTVTPYAFGADDILYAVLFQKMPNERTIRRLAKQLRIQQFFLRSSFDIVLCEQFSRLSSRLRAVPALFTVVEEAQQPIKICDEHNIVQYVNRAYELLTGNNRTNVLGTDGTTEPTGRRRPLNHVATATIAASAAAAVTAAVTWTAPTTEERTKTEQQQHNNRLSVDGQHQSVVDPSSAAGGGAGVCPPTADRRRSSDWQCIAVPTNSSSQQFVYVKRGSADAAFFQKGRSSGSLVDAPITEALNALGNVLHRCDEETQTQLREAMRILSSSELYTPNIMRFRENDCIASGYYDGLIRLHHPNRQRKRSVVDAFRDHQQRRVSTGSTVSGATATDDGTAPFAIGTAQQFRRRVSADIMGVLEHEHTWQFDVIQLERVTDHHPLANLGAKVFERWNVCEALECPSEVIVRWLTVIEANYQAGNAYHNATHAADVLQATSFFLNSDSVGQMIQDQHASAALIAATVHDLDHPGRGNAFLMNTRQRLALLYNDQSILENHHVALAFQLTLSQSGVNIFAKMPREEFTQMRQAIIDMVLATDMSRHFEHLAKFQQLMAIMPDNTEEERDANSLIICRMMVKCADIANPTREWRLCHEWAMRIVQEYFDQTAEETERKLPVTMKGFDRETCNVPLTQCTFVDMFAREAFTLWCEFADLPHLPVQLEENYAQWKTRSAEWDPKKDNDNLLKRTER
ncbi:hypothetical protein niasHT_009392 [Heterodera trifolii]|uniref:Phosphodiesterase n=1 Tax=Heterodera trifolii TaxID=157864 RepID=A0ABD2M3P9_9BILA